ncbi:phage portal protein [Pseudaestuariivita rosea]|uniref:phage portal protein n=1 Tax=Pseudaestuariivita rosea TaxID=2763263 RepID=UPI003AF59635
MRGLPRVSAELAERHATVFACCNIIAGDLSKVPLKVYERKAGGEEVRVREHPLEYLLNVECGAGMSAKVLRFVLVYALALRGNSYAYAPRDGGGEIEMIELVPQSSVGLLKTDRVRFYDFVDGADIPRRVPARAMVHLRYLPQDGWRGRSPIQVASDSVALALAGQQAAGRTAQGGTFKAVIKLEETYEDEEARVRNAQRVREALLNPEAAGFPVLSATEDIKSLDISAADQELLASRKMDREQIAAMYRMPPSKLQMLEYGVKANGEQQAIDYRTDCLLHWADQVEAQANLTLLTERERRERGLFFRHDFGRLMQPTVRDQYEALVLATGGPIMSPNTAQQIANLPITPGDDTLNPPPNMTRSETAGPDDDEVEDEDDG